MILFKKKKIKYFSTISLNKNKENDQDIKIRKHNFITDLVSFGKYFFVIKDFFNVLILEKLH